jgi:hypothetical protein
MWMQAPGLLGRGGRHQGLLHFSVKKSVASQRKQLRNPIDCEYIQRWLGADHQGVWASSSLRQDVAKNQRTAVLNVRDGSSTTRSARNVEQTLKDQETSAKPRARMERFNENSVGRHSEASSKGKGKQRRVEDAHNQFVDDVAKRPKQSRWRKTG